MANYEIRKSGTHIQAAPSDQIVIRLEEIATTGYRWSVNEVSDGLHIEANDFRPPQHRAAGAGGEREVVLRAVESGTGHIAMSLRRPWDPEPIAHFEAEITVA